MSRLADQLGVWVVLGSAHQLTEPNRPHNSLYVISDQGRVFDRYDKRICSTTEITEYYSPGFEPIVFDVDGFRFGCAICVEINSPQLFSSYEQLGVDCLLLSAYPSRSSELGQGVPDSIFDVKARAHASINCYWVALSAPQQTADLVPSGLIGPNGAKLAEALAGSDLVITTLDREAKDLQVALTWLGPGGPAPGWARYTATTKSPTSAARTGIAYEPHPCALTAIRTHALTPRGGGRTDVERPAPPSDP